MARPAAIELDLFSIEKKAKWPPIFERRRSFRDIQDVTSKINPEMLKSVIANNSHVLLTTPKSVCDPPLLGLSLGSENKAENGSMTIFYNGMVVVFDDVSPHKAQDILKLAEESTTVVIPKPAESSESHSYEKQSLLETLYGDLPLARRKSLQRFLEKRKQRLAMVSPCDCSSTNSSLWFRG